MEKGYFGQFGGSFVPEAIQKELDKLSEAYDFYKEDSAFQRELKELLNDYAGRPSYLYYAKNMTEKLGGAKIYLKREDLNHTGAHKINNALGQALLAKKMGKTRIIAETGAGQHGVATATAAALLGLSCEIFMGKEDIRRQAVNVDRMKLLGAKVTAVHEGMGTLKEAVDKAFEEWVNSGGDTFYLLGSAVGPAPYPEIVRDFQKVISEEALEQIKEKEGRLPDEVIACIGGGSNAIGMFHAFVPYESVKLVGCEAAGKGLSTGQHAASISTGKIGIIHGMKTYYCQEEDGSISDVYSISAGLDYPGIGPEHAYLKEIGRASYVPVTDEEAMAAFRFIARTEGIICAIESAHAIAYAMKEAPNRGKDQILIVCLSGRGDKDVAEIMPYL
ncbi:MAG: tryptophan synthase subunit beta [Eubacteriales bacterium]|nr:tryptophan synthase subunit beta [Eubacteriales bacterium]